MNYGSWVLPAIVTLMMTGSAVAQDRALTVQPYSISPYGDETGFEDFGVPVDALPTPFSHGGSCVKMCEFDRTPCDPDYWKVADRRCNFNQRG